MTTVRTESTESTDRSTSPVSITKKVIDTDKSSISSSIKLLKQPAFGSEWSASTVAHKHNSKLPLHLPIPESGKPEKKVKSDGSVDISLDQFIANFCDEHKENLDPLAHLKKTKKTKKGDQRRNNKADSENLVPPVSKGQKMRNNKKASEQRENAPISNSRI